MDTQLDVKALRFNGTEIHYIEQGAGDPVVFVHGGNMDYRSWMSQLGPFARHYHIISYSRRYHFPNAGAERARGYLATEHRDDLAALIDILGLQPAHIVASSYGAYVALLVARAQPELIRSLVLGEPPVPSLLGPDAAKAMALELDPSRRAFERGDPEGAVRLFLDSRVGPGAFDRFPSSVRQVLLDNAPEFRLELSTSPDEYFAPFSCEDAQAIHVPTLLLNGQESPESLYRMTDELARCLPSAERAIVAHASHGMHNQNAPAYNEAVLAFLARH